MKKFIQNIVIFFFIILVFDIVFGKIFQYMNDHSKGGGVKNRYYICKESNENVLIFGSSRARHHYVPEIIEHSLNLTCYNTGEDGNGIILCYGYLKMITQRYSPQKIIYDVSVFDIYKGDNVKFLDLLKPFYHEPGIDSIFWKINPKTRLMMLSNMYRYNTTCLRVVINFIHPMTNYSKGYFPLYKTMNYEPTILPLPKVEVDHLKLYYFEEFIKLVTQKKIELVCCVSPSYMTKEDSSYYNPIKQLCEQYSIPFLYLGADPEISQNKEYFQDRTHMNDRGARRFTEKIIPIIQKYW